MADLATLQTRLAEAESAFHKLVIGGQAVEIQHGDMRKRYTPGEAGELASYIDRLKSEIELLGGTVAGLRRRGLVVDL